MKKNKNKLDEKPIKQQKTKKITKKEMEKSDLKKKIPCKKGYKLCKNE